MHGNLYLIGLMGAGKTTVGRKLAALMKLEFVDTDQLLEKRTGVSVSHIFEIEGEEGFRERETRLFQEISESQMQVVSTGGGLILNPVNRTRMRQTGSVIYLRASLDVLWKRLKDCHTRPLLQTANPRARLQQLIVERDPVYVSQADYIIDVGTGPAAKAAAKIRKMITDGDARAAAEQSL